MKSHVLPFILLLVSAFAARAITYAEWQALHFSVAQIANPSVSGPMADPDGDGGVNIVEYATGTDPWVPDLPAVVLTGTGTDGRLTLTYPRRKSHPGILYAVQSASPLSGVWRSGPDFVEQTSVVSLDADWESVTVRDRGNIASSRVRFMRLLVAVDSDNDGLPDDWEIAVFGSITAQSGSDDFDLDGLSNLLEWQHGTDPKDYYNGTRPPGIPAAPSDVSVSMSMGGGMDVYWIDNSNNETGFVVREHRANGTVVELGRTGPNPSYFHTASVTLGNIGVAAFSPEGESKEAMETTPGLIAAAPRKPLLHAVRLNRSKVRLTWEAGAGAYDSTDKIYLYRSTDDGPWVQIAAPQSATATEWKNAAAPDHRYIYTAVVTRDVTDENKLPLVTATVPSYAADYVTDYYLDVEILFYTTNDEDFPGGELDAAGFIPDSWTQDSVLLAPNVWPLVGNRISKLGVVKWEPGPANGAEPANGASLAGYVYSSSLYGFGGRAEEINALEVKWHGANISNPGYIEELSPFATTGFILEALSYAQGAWTADPAPVPGVPALSNPKGFDRYSMPNALMVPPGAGNQITYDAGSNPPGTPNNLVTLAVPSGFTSSPAGPLDTNDAAGLYSLSISGTATGVATLTASRPPASQRKLALVPMRPPDIIKKVAVYSVQLVDFFGQPVNDGHGNPVLGSAPSRFAIQGLLDTVFTKQANVTFDVQPLTVIQVKYKDYTTPAFPGLPESYTGKLRLDWPQIINPSTGQFDDDESWQVPFQEKATLSGADYTLFFVSGLDVGLGDAKGESSVSNPNGKFAVIAAPVGINNSTDKVIMGTVAHEMGHLLGLWHPFGPPHKSSNLLDNLANMLTYPEPDMDRLMDYHAGTRLIRKEWEIINPQLNQ